MKISSAQAHWFRLRRSGLVEPFKTPEAAAHQLIGVQAQLLPAASLSFWNRTAACSRQALEEARLERRTLVRFWGQRNTVHTYSTSDWPFLHAVFAARQSLTMRRLERAGLFGDFLRLVRRTEKRLADGAHLTYKDVQSRKIAEGQEMWRVSYVTFMQLVREGVTCHAFEEGGESHFVHRRHWVPDLEWTPPAAEDALPLLAERYLAAYGPAEARDLAFWYGGTLTDARRWIEAAGKRCREIQVGGQARWGCKADLDEMSEKPPPATSWPVRLLYRFDPLLLATKDKSWLIDEADYKKVWRAAAHVEPVLLVRGRIAGTWRYDRKAKGLVVSVKPFKRLPATVQREVRKQATGVARFLGLPLADLSLQA